MDDKWWSEGNYVWRITPKGDDVKRVKVTKFKGRWPHWGHPSPDLQVGVGRDKIELWLSMEPMRVYRSEIDALSALQDRVRQTAESAEAHVAKARMELDSAQAHLLDRRFSVAEVSEKMRRAKWRAEVHDA